MNINFLTTKNYLKTRIYQNVITKYPEPLPARVRDLYKMPWLTLVNRGVQCNPP